jgi:hypothetical protein
METQAERVLIDRWVANTIVDWPSSHCFGCRKPIVVGQKLPKARFAWLTALATTREKLVDQSFRQWRREGSLLCLTPQRPASGDFLLGSPHRLAVGMKTGPPIVTNELEPPGRRRRNPDRSAMSNLRFEHRHGAIALGASPRECQIIDPAL